MKKRYLVSLVMIIMGFLIFAASLGESMLVIKGDKINLNKAKQADLNEKHLIEGEIDFVYGPFATYEETSTTYGIETRKKETNFYIVGNFSDEMFNGDEEYEQFYAVFSTADKDMMKKLDAAAKDWVNWLSSEDMNEEPPKIKIDFEGKLSEESSDKDYIKYKNEALDDLKNVNIKREDVTVLRIVEGKVGFLNVALCAGGFLVGIAGIVILIVSLVKSRKKKDEELYF